jgi:hypothetical protein
MIKAATVRAQITQFQKFNTAANTFKIIYGYLPGDIPPGLRHSLGFIPIAIVPASPPTTHETERALIDTQYGVNGEDRLFWLDLSQARLIDQSFSIASWTAAGADPCNYG